MAFDDACTSHSHLRCPCGSLLARLVEGGVELKCRRCKRLVVVPLQQPASDEAPPRRLP